jgi:NAD(P)H dehydrogenase (quinone)
VPIPRNKEWDMFTVTGASSRLGRHVLGELHYRGVAAGEIITAARNPRKAVDLTSPGVDVIAAQWRD